MAQPLEILLIKARNDCIRAGESIFEVIRLIESTPEYKDLYFDLVQPPLQFLGVALQKQADVFGYINTYAVAVGLPSRDWDVV